MSVRDDLIATKFHVPAAGPDIMLNQITDWGLVVMPKFTALEELSIGGGKITSSGLAVLAKVPSLHYLRPWGFSLNDDALLQVRKISSLKTLDVAHLKITDVGLAHLAGLRVDDLEAISREVDEALLAGAVLLAHDHVELAPKLTVQLAELTVLVALVALRFLVLLPHELKCYPLPTQLSMNLRPVRQRSRLHRRRRRRIEQRLEGAIVEIGAEQTVRAGDVATMFDWSEGSSPEDVAVASGGSVYDLLMHLNPLLPRFVMTEEK